MFDFIFGNGQTFKGNLFKEPFEKKVHKLTNDNSYNIEFIRQISNNSQSSIVNLFKVEFLSTESKNIIKTFFLVGKTFKSSNEINEYVEKYNCLSELNFINFPAFVFENNVEVNLKGIRKEELNLTLFLVNFSVGHNVIPINNKNSLNKQIFNFSKKIRIKIYEKTLEDLEKLIENDIWISYFDLWFIIYSKTQVHMEIVDLDFLKLGYTDKTYLKLDLFGFFHNYSKERELFRKVLKSKFPNLEKYITLDIKY